MVHGGSSRRSAALLEGEIMNHDRMAAMAEATALTRAGRLAEATELIRRTLSGTAPASDEVPDVVPGEIVIDDPAQRRPGPTVRDGATRARPPVAPDLDGHPDQPADDHADDHAIALPAGTALAGGTTAHVYRGPAGARSYLLHVPATGTGPRPLLVMLHGGTQTAADFATATRIRELAEEHGFLVAFPEQTTAANSLRYWNWFQPDDQRRGAGEPAILVGIVDEVAAAHEVDRDRIHVAGFSAGGAMAAVLGAVYPDVFAAVGVHSGLPYGCAHDVGSAFAAMRTGAAATPLRRPVPVITFHGDADQTVAVDNAARVVAQFSAGAPRGDTLVERGPTRPATRTVVRRGGAAVAEQWTVHGSGHAWSGGAAGGSYTDPGGPDASAEMVRFFAEHPRRG
jgi:poly(hydroxyalkanoate) depolymerase family esterase